jgi:hypothetical protein
MTVDSSKKISPNPAYWTSFSEKNEFPDIAS